MSGTAVAAAGTFPHPLDRLPVTRVFTIQAVGLLPAAVLDDPEHPWLRRQEWALPRGVLSVVYHRDGVELVTPQGVRRRPFVGQTDLSRQADPSPAQEPRRTAKITAAERAKAWRAANRDKVKAQHSRKAQHRKAARDQLLEALAASNSATRGRPKG